MMSIHLRTSPDFPMRLLSLCVRVITRITFSCTLYQPFWAFIRALFSLSFSLTLSPRMSSTNLLKRSLLCQTQTPCVCVFHVIPTSAENTETEMWFFSSLLIDLLLKFVFLWFLIFKSLIPYIWAQWVWFSVSFWLSFSDRYKFSCLFPVLI